MISFPTVDICVATTLCPWKEDVVTPEEESRMCLAYWGREWQGVAGLLPGAGDTVELLDGCVSLVVVGRTHYVENDHVCIFCQVISHRGLGDLKEAEEDLIGAGFERLEAGTCFVYPRNVNAYPPHHDRNLLKSLRFKEETLKD